MPVDSLLLLFGSSGEQRVARVLDGMATRIGRVESASDRMGRIGGTWAAAGAVGGAALLRLSQNALQAAGEVQRVQIGFQTVLKDAGKVNQLMAGVRDFDVRTPFSYLETAKASQMLLASGFREDLLPTLNAVGQAVVAAGGDTARFTRALSIMAKIKTAGILTGVRVNQFAAAGINVKEILKEQLGLSDEEMINIGKLKLKADVVIPALIKGLDEKFKGGIERAANSYLGSIEVFHGSVDKLNASIGKAIMPDAVKVVKWMIRATDAVEKFTSTHPRLTKYGMYLAGLTSVFVTAKGALMVYRYYSLQAAAAQAIVAASVTKTAQANTAAAIAQNAETAAEARKIPVAYAEAAAHNVAAAAVTRHAMANAALVASSRGGMLGAGASALPALMPAGGASVVPNAGGAAGGSALARWLLTPVRAGLVNSSGIAVSRLQAGFGIATGVGAGVGIRNDLKASGFSDERARNQAIASGVGIAVLNTLVPPARIFTLAALALRYGINKYYNEPAERKAEGGSGADNAEMYGKDINDRLMAQQKAAASGTGNRRDLAATYSELSTKAQQAGDDAQAANFAEMAIIQRSIAKKEATVGSPEYLAKERKRQQPFLDKYGPQSDPGSARRLAQMEAQGYDSSRLQGYYQGEVGNSPEIQAKLKAQQSDTRRDGYKSGKQTIEFTWGLPESKGDAMARQAKYNRMSPRKV